MSSTRSRTENPCEYGPRSMVNRGVVIWTRYDAKHRKMMRMTSAPARPSLRPMCCFSAGRRFVVMEMNTKLSTPKTISRKINVTRLIHASGVANMLKVHAFSFLLNAAAKPLKPTMRGTAPIAAREAAPMHKKRLTAQTQRTSSLSCAMSLANSRCSRQAANRPAHDVESIAPTCQLLPHGHGYAKQIGAKAQCYNFQSPQFT